MDSDNLRSTARLELSGLKSHLVGPFEMKVGAGAIVAITGSSGAGKSLFLRLIADLDPGEGLVRLNGVDRSAHAPTEWRRKVTYAAAEAGWWHANVFEHFPASELEPARHLAARFGVGRNQFEGPVDRLSTGERLRMSLVRAFLLKPAVLMLDEPTGALDPTSTSAVESYVKEVAADGTAVLLVTHQQEQIARLNATHYRIVARKLELVA